MKAKLNKLLKINLSLIIYTLIICIVVIIVSYANYVNRANKSIDSTIESINTNIDKEDLETLNKYVYSIFSTINKNELSENEIVTNHVSEFGHLKEYEEYKSCANAISLVYNANKDIYDLSLLYIDLDNNRMVYLADKGEYDLGVFRGLSYSFYSKIVLKKRASLYKSGETWVLFRGANIVNDNNKVIATVNVSINLNHFKENVINILITALIIYLVTALAISIVFLKIPSAYKKASIYLKAIATISLSKKEKRKKARALKKQKKKEAKKKEEKEIEEELKKDILEENKEKYKKETVQEEAKAILVESKEEIKEEELEESQEELKEEIEPMSKPRETKEGEEEHPVIDWIVDQL